jgi:hypothetical protein
MQNLLPQEKPKNWFSRHMLLGYIFLIFAFAAVVAIIYLAQNPKKYPTSQSQTTTQADTSTWQTYINTTDGFSFKYPNGFFVFPDTNEYLVYDKNVQPTGLSENYDSMKITISPFSSVPYTKQNFEDDLNGSFNTVVLSSKDITISGYTAYEFNLKGPSVKELQDPYGANTNVSVGVPFPNGGGFDIDFESKKYSGTQEYQKELNLFDQILSTLEFIPAQTLMNPDLLPIYNKFKWYPPQSVMYIYYANGIAGNPIALKGYSIQAAFDSINNPLNNFQDQAQTFRNYYDQKLIAAGWQKDEKDTRNSTVGSSFSSWGYIKSDKHIIFDNHFFGTAANLDIFSD